MSLPIEYNRAEPGVVVGRFRLMASPCEVHIRSADVPLAHRLIEQVYREGQRIEQHFSRYRQDNLLYRINTSQGQAITLDAEYTRLLDYALQLFTLSDGLFDISSGVLRHFWTFDTREQPDALSAAKVAELKSARARVGLNHIDWQPPVLCLPAGMELDFGGIGKEYAVDRAAQQIEQAFSGHYLINFGGDCYCRGSQQRPWRIAIEAPTSKAPSAQAGDNAVTLTHGGVATSGTSKRYFVVNGRQYGHILNPKTGYPVQGAPLSVTIVNASCVAAGAMATLAMLQGERAEAFLAEQELLHWVLR
jgi:thiamine biosynthesis lipoprotein